MQRERERVLLDWVYLLSVYYMGTIKRGEGLPYWEKSIAEMTLEDLKKMLPDLQKKKGEIENYRRGLDSFGRSGAAPFSHSSPDERLLEMVEEEIRNREIK